MTTLRSLIGRFRQNAIDARHPVRSLARWPRWLVACATGKRQVATFAAGGLRMRLIPKLTQFGTTSLFIKRDAYEPELLAVRRLIRPGDVVLDIGGSYGVYTLFCAHFVGPRGHVHVFEPGALSHVELVANVAANGLRDRVTIHHAAASDRPGELRLAHIAGSPVNFSISDGDDVATEVVPAVRVDAVVPPDDATRVTFIKADVEGYERSALEGARAIVEARKPVILFEVSASALERQGRQPADIYAVLRELGYAFWMLDGQSKFVPVTGSPEGNIFAAPLGRVMPA